MGKRHTVLGKTIAYAGMAMNLRTIRRTTDDTVRNNARHHLAERMGKLRGLPQKIGQIMSCADDADQAAVFEHLTDHAEPIPFDQVRPLLEVGWNAAPSSVVREIETVGLAASLGQVHRATLFDGREVAVKVAYPGIRAAVHADLKVLGWLSVPLGDLRRGFNLGDYRSEIARDLDEELDYDRELSNQQRFGEMAEEMVGLVVPRAHPELSSDGVLVSDWEDGDRIDAVITWPAPAREELARRMLQHFLTCTFKHGFLHGDPHAGNYRFRNDSAGGPSVVLYDYGSIAQISQRDRLLLLKLIADTVDRVGDPTASLVALGFNDHLLSPIRAKMPALCSVLFEPFTQIGKYSLGDWHRSERINDILSEHRWNFRMAAPARFILLMRAFRGLLYYLERLNTPVSWRLAIRPFLTNHAAELAAIELPTFTSDEGTFESIATHMRIEVRRDGVQKVSLTLPASAVENLEDMIEPEITERITERSLDLKEIIRSARRGGFAPTELFRLDEPDEQRTIRVWLE